MALNIDLDAGDILVVPTDSGAQIRVLDKSGRRTRVAVDSAKPVHVLRGKDAQHGIPDIPRPKPSAPNQPQRPKA